MEYNRDIIQLQESLQTLAGYIEMCKRGRLEFALDIPTQVYKAFFDRNPRNNQTTLFERVCNGKNITFHPLCYRFILVTHGDLSFTFGLHAGNSEKSDEYSELVSQHIDLKANPIPLGEWESLTLYTAMQGGPLEQQAFHPTDHVKDSNSDSVPDIDREVIAIVASHEVTRFSNIIHYDILKSNGRITKTTSLSEPIHGITTSDDDHMQFTERWCKNIIENPNNFEISIVEFFKLLRHKNSAHTDPLDNPKLEDEYNRFYTAEVLSTLSEKPNSIMIAIAEYLVVRVNSELLSE